MKTIYRFLSSFVILALLLGGIPASVFAGDAATNGDGEMPGYPIPAKPIPYTEVGKVSKAGSYHTTAQVESPVLNPQTGEYTKETIVQTVSLSGVDALAADGLDPLAGNYTLVNRETVQVGSLNSGTTKLITYGSGAGSVPVNFSDISSGGMSRGSVVDYDATSGDLNNDGQTEHIEAYTDSSNTVYLGVRDFPPRATSAPAVVVQNNGYIDILVRGYDDALWHNRYNGSNWWPDWENGAGGTLLSASAIASIGDGTFDVFHIGADNCTYKAHYNGSSWGGWTLIEPARPCPALVEWVGATPELPALAAVANGSGFDVFRLDSDNTLNWNHSSDGTTWDGWQSMGGMLATGPAAVSTGAGQMQVFALGADGALWFRVYDNGNCIERRGCRRDFQLRAQRWKRPYGLPPRLGSKDMESPV
jgi:hypothetical protein